MNQTILATKITSYVSVFPASFHDRIARFCKDDLKINPEYFLCSESASTTVVVLSQFSLHELTSLLQFVEELNAEFLASPMYTIQAAMRHYYDNAGKEEKEEGRRI